MKALLRWLYRLTASASIVMALTMVLVSQLLPLAERHPELISRWLTERTGLPIHFNTLTTGWTKRGPLLQFDNLHIGEGNDAIRIGQAEILVAHYTGWLPGRSFTELRLRGLTLTLEQLEDGRWQVRGLPGSVANDTDPLSALGKLGELQVTSAKLGITAPALGIDTRIPDVDLRVRVNGSRARIALNARMQPQAAPLLANLDLDRRSGNARAFAAIDGADLATWSPLLRVDGLMLADGQGSIDAWAELQNYHLSVLTTRADLDRLIVQRITDEDQVRFGQVHARLHWHKKDNQWRFDAPKLRIGDPVQPQILDGLMLAGGAQLALHATRIDAGPLLAIAALSPRLPPSLRHWLQTAKPDASARDITLTGNAEHGLRGSLSVSKLHFASVGQTPGVAGLSGQITLDMHGALLELDPANPVRFNWPTGFGTPHHLNLTGTLAAWWTNPDGGIRLMTPALRVDADGYAADVRGGLWFHTDGRRPRIDIAATLDTVEIPVAKRFWVRSEMSQAAMEWLDMALVSGKLRQGRALISGELANWPFDARDGQHVRGIFEAQGELTGANLRFQPDWPLLDNFTGPIRFFNDGFSLRGKARIGGITLNKVRARLPHYSQDHLKVSTHASGDMHNWLALLRQSPLNADYGEILDHLDASGPATSNFAMTLALGSGRDPTIEGQATLEGVSLSEQRWNVAFSDVRGPVHYDQYGFTSRTLSGRHDGHHGLISLRAGEGHVHDARHAFEADMQAEINAGTLLARAPQLDWLTPHLSGRSRWTLALTMDANASTPGAGNLSLESNLVGTALTLPAPLNKPASEPLPTHIHTRLPWDKGEIQATLSERLALRTRSSNGQTATHIALGQSEAPAPDSGLVISGRVPRLDATGWAAIGASASIGTNPAPTPRLDLQIDQLHLPGADFANVQIDTQTNTGATVLNIQSPALAGRVHWPSAPNVPLNAELTRLYWPTPLHAGFVPPADPKLPTHPPISNTDPRKFPPFNLTVADLRLSETRLGKASVRIKSGSEGLDIDEFQIHGPQQHITARGAWTTTHTRLELDLDSQNIGQLLAGLGLGHQVKDGTGTLHFRGHWPGSPMDFTAVRLSGQMNLGLREGQLLDVEPGAGRILGLLSLTQLPRRLMLDFRDFFGKGFSFNEISGSVDVAEGIAYIGNLRINGPSAKIRISGSSNLSTQTHDQMIEVAPRTGNLLPIVGAFAGGPLGAAMGAAANAAFKGPLSEVGGKTYRVTGPWQEPKVEASGHKTASTGPVNIPPDAPESEHSAPPPVYQEQQPPTPPQAQIRPPPAAPPRPAH